MNHSSSVGSRYLLALATASLALVVVCASAASWAALRAQLERNTVQEADTLTLIIESDGRQSGERPDLRPLDKDFDVLGTSTSTEVRFINFARSDRTRWSVRLHPRHTGSIEIPPISVGSEQTTALELKVTEALPQAANQAATHVFIEAEAPAADKSIYVQQQIPYTVRLFYDDTIQSGELAAPDPANAIVEQLGEEKRYTAMRDGREFNVIERRYAIAPEKSGALSIPPARFRGIAVVPRSVDANDDATGDLMDRFLRNTPFANDPLFQSRLRAGNAGQPVSARSQQMMFEVQPRPAAARGNWLPAEQITLHDSWEESPPKFKVGEPVTRTITIDAKGVAASQIPSLSLPQPADARLYPEASDNQSRTDGDAIYGISKQSVTYIPTTQGTLTIPAVELTWWNTRTNSQSVAALEARQFKVDAGTAEAQSRAAPPILSNAAATTPTAPIFARNQPQVPSIGDRLLSRWTWLVAGAALLAVMILSGVAILRSRRRAFDAGQRAATGAKVPQRNSIMRALHQACVANDRQAAAHALLQLALVEWPNDPPRGLSALATRLEVGSEEISALDQSLYGADGSRWKGDGLWEVFRRGLRPARSETLSEDDGLSPLYL